MAGWPVTIRLLDRRCTSSCPRCPTSRSGCAPPRRRIGDVATLEQDLARVRALQEVNPMLGTRGVRLGILFPAIYEMQVEAIFAALKATRERGSR